MGVVELALAELELVDEEALAELLLEAVELFVLDAVELFALVVELLLAALLLLVVMILIELPSLQGGLEIGINARVEMGIGYTKSD